MNTELFSLSLNAGSERKVVITQPFLLFIVVVQSGDKASKHQFIEPRIVA
jgi:hypothetical protein